MKEGKTNGKNGLVILKAADDVVTNGISKIFIKILGNYEIPKDWTTGTIALLNKRSDIRNLKKTTVAW